MADLSEVPEAGLRWHTHEVPSRLIWRRLRLRQPRHGRMEAQIARMINKHQFTVGIDLGGTTIRVGLFDADLQLLASRSMITRVAAGPRACIGDMAEAIDALLADQELRKSAVLGAGIGSPGPMNLRTGVLGLLPNLPGWDNFPLRDVLAEVAGLPVVLESDANAAALAEWKLGAGKEAGVDSMAMLTLGTGVGSGLILKGRVWHGMFGMGGEVGHTTVETGGWLCGCGSKGCLEAYASATGLIRLVRHLVQTGEPSAELRRLTAEPDGFTPRQVAQLADAGDRSAKQAYERLGFYLGIGVANLINSLDLPMVVIGGGVAQAWPLFAPALFRTVQEYSVVYRLATPTQLEFMETDRTYIRPAMLGPSAGLLGAALLPTLQPA